MSVLVTYGSKRGGTMGLAEMVATGSRAFSAASACAILCGCHPDARRISGVGSSGCDEGSGLREGRRVMS